MGPQRTDINLPQAAYFIKFDFDPGQISTGITLANSFDKRKIECYSANATTFDSQIEMTRISKNLMLLIAAAMISFSVSGVSLGQEWARSMFNTLSHDFGNVPKGKRPEFRFEIENKFKEDIRIRSVVSSCGCTTVSVTSKLLKSFQKSEVVCLFNSHAFDGFKQATVRVQFDRPFVGEVQLTVKGNIVRTNELSLTPTEIDFGQITGTDYPERVINLERLGNPSFRIVDVKSSFPHIKVSLKETKRNASLVNYEMRTQLKPSVPAGVSEGDLFVVVEENNARRQVPIHFNAKVVAIKISPEILTLSNVKPGQEIKKTVIIQAAKAFKIVDVKCKTQAFRVRQKKKGKSKVHLIEVFYTGEDEVGSHECDLSFYTDLNEGVTGTVKTVVNIVE